MGPFPVGDTDGPLSGSGYELAPFQLGIWTGPFAARDVAPFRLGLWTRRFPVGDMDWPLSLGTLPLCIWGYGPAHFHLGIWTSTFLAGDLD